MNKHDAQCILAARDCLLKDDKDGAYHYLYRIASPGFNKLSHEVWEELESIANGERRDYEAMYNDLNESIGELQPGQHPDERKPRATTWLQERANWENEVSRLRGLLGA